MAGEGQEFEDDGPNGTRATGLGTPYMFGLGLRSGVLYTAGTQVYTKVQEVQDGPKVGLFSRLSWVETKDFSYRPGANYVSYSIDEQRRDLSNKLNRVSRCRSQP